MGLMRFTAAAMLALLATTGTSSAQCVSEVRVLVSRNDFPEVVARAAAWNGSILAVAVEQIDNGAVWAYFYNDRGDALYPNLRISNAEGDEILDNIWNGDHFGIFFRTDNGDLVLRRLSTTGEVIGGPVVPLQGRLREEDRVDIIWSSRLEAYLVARTSHAAPRTVILTILNRDGTRRSVRQLDAHATNSYIRVAETASGVIGVFYEQDVTRDMMMISLHADHPEVKRRVWSSGEPPVIAAWDNQFVFVRAVLQGDGRRVLRWKAINTAGFDTRDERRLFVGTGVDVEPLSLMVRGEEFALSYLDARDGFATQTPSYRLARFSPNGTVVSDTLFAAAEPQRHRAATRHDFIWTGEAFLAVAVRETSEGDDSLLVRLCPLQARVAGPNRVHRNTTATFVAAPEGGVPGFTYEWRYDGTGFSTGPTLQRMHTVNGQYSVELTVTDSSGALSRETFTYVVFDPSQPRRRSVRK
jgi:hypothetical protein